MNVENIEFVQSIILQNKKYHKGEHNIFSALTQKCTLYDDDMVYYVRVVYDVWNEAIFFLNYKLQSRLVT